jgi:hypothetical protein
MASYILALAVVTGHIHISPNSQLACSTRIAVAVANNCQLLVLPAGAHQDSGTGPQYHPLPTGAAADLVAFQSVVAV